MSKPDQFEFRNFIMLQAPSGQRINTDSCVVGALVCDSTVPKRVIDIGTGTGLIALMLAVQHQCAEIVGIEPEPEIAKVTRLNFERSMGASRLSLLEKRAQELCRNDLGVFDLVVCNPPYFENSFVPIDPLRKTARHTTDLTPKDVFEAFDRLLTEDGAAWFSCPFSSKDSWLRVARDAGFFCGQDITVADHPGAKPHLSVISLGRKSRESLLQTIYYRTALKGPSSDWMGHFRRTWFPSRYHPDVALPTPI